MAGQQEALPEAYGHSYYVTLNNQQPYIILQKVVDLGGVEDIEEIDNIELEVYIWYHSRSVCTWPELMELSNTIITAANQSKQNNKLVLLLLLLCYFIR